MVTRDSFVWWLALAGAVLTYLVSAERPPTEWRYLDWLQALSFVVAWLAGKLSGSMLAGAATPTSESRPGLGGLVQLHGKEST